MARRSVKKKTPSEPLTRPPADKMESLEQAVEALKASDNRFRTIVQTLPSILHLLDHRKRTYYISPNCEKIAGYPPEILKRIGNWIHPEDVAKVQRVFDQSYRKKTAGKNFEYRAVRKNGETWIASASWEPIQNENGSFQGFVVQTADVTAQKKTEMALLESELKYRTLFEETGDAVTLTSEEGKFLAANRSARRLFGIKTQKELSEASIVDFFDRPEDRPPLLRKIQRKGFVRDYEVPYRNRAGELIQGLVSTVLHKDQAGRPLYLAVIRDITKKKRVEEAIRESEKKYRSLIEATGTDFVILDPEDSTLIFRLVQERLTNIIRHAEAQTVKITLKKNENQVILTVRDNGLGITPDRINDPRSLGLIGMRERVYARDGSIQIRGLPQGGTKIAVELSLNRRGNRHDKNISRR